MYTLKGELKTINTIVQVSDSFKKREFVVTDSSGSYVQTILFQLVQDKCELIDGFKVGDNVEVTFFLRGREWTNPKDGEIKVFNSLDAWKINKIGGESNPDSSEEDDNLPF